MEVEVYFGYSDFLLEPCEVETGDLACFLLLGLLVVVFREAVVVVIPLFLEKVTEFGVLSLLGLGEEEVEEVDGFAGLLFHFRFLHVLIFLIVLCLTGQLHDGPL